MVLRFIFVCYSLLSSECSINTFLSGIDSIERRAAVVPRAWLYTCVSATKMYVALKEYQKVL